MKTVWALAVKFGMTLVAIALAGYLVGIIDWGVFLVVAIVGTVVNYVLGDLFVLPAAGNIVASIGDGGMAAFIAYIITIRNRTFAVDRTIMFAVLFGVLVAIGEYFFHKWIASEEKVSPNP
jgi:hypothetical protein